MQKKLKITEDHIQTDGGRRIDRRRSGRQQPTFMAGMASRERAMSVARDCQTRISVETGERERGRGERKRGNRQLCQNSNEPQTLFSFRRWRTGRSLGKARLRPQNEITKPLLRTRECVPGPKRNDDDSKRID